MAGRLRLEVTQAGDVSIVRFSDRRILDEANIQEIAQELFDLVENQGHTRLLLSFADVEFLSSAALGKLITLDKKVKAQDGELVLCCLRPEIFEVFAITRLNQIFDIKEDESEALAAF